MVIARNWRLASNIFSSSSSYPTFRFMVESLAGRYVVVSLVFAAFCGDERIIVWFDVEVRMCLPCYECDQGVSMHATSSTSCAFLP